eukprot:COSAG02_NODE_28810_length_582_cov_0.616977_1_plen_90_part_01
METSLDGACLSVQQPRLSLSLSLSAMSESARWTQGIHGKASSGSAHAERMRRMRIMHGVGGDPDARYPRKMAHSDAGDNVSSVVDRWGGS